MLKIEMSKAVPVETFQGAKATYVTFAFGQGMLKLAFTGNVSFVELEPVSLVAECRVRSYGTDQSIEVIKYSSQKLNGDKK